MCGGVVWRSAFHKDTRSADAVVLRMDEWLRKRLLDFNRCLAAVFPYRRCLSSVDCFWRLIRLATSLLIVGGAIPARMCKFAALVGLRYPVTTRQKLLRAGSSFSGMCWPLPHRAGIFGGGITQGKGWCSEQWGFRSPFRGYLFSSRCLFLVLVLASVFSICCLYDRERSSVTPR